jgi:hypothetical protein
VIKMMSRKRRKRRNNGNGKEGVGCMNREREGGKEAGW